MRKTLIVLLTFTLAMASVSVSAQTKASEQRKVRKELRKTLNEKVSKDAKKEAKELEREGWRPAAGARPLEKQLDKRFMMNEEEDDYGMPKYILASASSVAGSFDAAKMQAMSIAKTNLASQLGSEVRGITENSLANNQFTTEDAATLTESVTKSIDEFGSKIGRVIVVYEAYRNKMNRNVEVALTIAYPSDIADQMAKEMIIKNLGDKADALRERVENMFKR